MNNTTRRNFLKTSAAVSSFFVLPSGLLSKSPNSRICSAHIGTGGKGRTDTTQIANHERVQVLGLCDVDRKRGQADAYLKQHTSAKFTNWPRRVTSQSLPPKRT
jgi:hypothetical protein